MGAGSVTACSPDRCRLTRGRAPDRARIRASVLGAVFRLDLVGGPPASRASRRSASSADRARRARARRRGALRDVRRRVRRAGAFPVPAVPDSPLSRRRYVVRGTDGGKSRRLGLEGRDRRRVEPRQDGAADSPGCGPLGQSSTAGAVHPRDWRHRGEDAVVDRQGARPVVARVGERARPRDPVARRAPPGAVTGELETGR